MALRLVFHPLGEVFLFVAEDALLFKLGLEGVVQFVVPGDEARFKQGGLGEHVQVGLLDGPFNGARGMAHFEPDIPKHAQDRLDDGSDLLGHHRRLVQEHQIDVAVRAEFAPTKPADGHQGDAAACLARSRAPGRRIVEVAQDNIHKDGALLGDLAPAPTRLVLEPQAVVFDLEKLFVQRQQRRLVIHPLGGELLFRVSQHHLPVPGGAGCRTGKNRGNGYG